MNTVSHYLPGNIAVSCIQTAGARHRDKQQPCEDSTFLRSTQDWLFCGIADGQSGAPYGREGGRACLEAVSEYIDAAGIGNILNASFPDELPCAITKAFRKRLLTLSEAKGAPLEDFSSTLLAMAVDLKTGKYVILHLGDGCAVSIPVSGEFILVSTPDTGLSHHHTWLTTSDNAVSHLRIRFGSLKNQKRILLLSDGAACFCQGKNIPWRIRDFLRNGGMPQLQEHLMQSEPTDDATCILVDCSDAAVL